MVEAATRRLKGQYDHVLQPVVTNNQSIVLDDEKTNHDPPNKNMKKLKYILIITASFFFVLTCMFNAQRRTAYFAQSDFILVEQKEQAAAAICAIQKGALPYIDEWVDYNIALGFEKLFIYDNSDDFELKEWQDHHKHSSKVDVIQFPGKKKAQIAAYNHCAKSIQQEEQFSKFSWIAFIDLEEFIVINNTNQYPTIMDVLKTVPEDAGGLALNWKIFKLTKYNLHWNDTSIPVTLRNQYRSPETNIHIKTIARTQLLQGVTVHTATYVDGAKTVDTNGNVVEGPFNYKLTTDIASIHHMWTKSIEEFKSRCARGRADVIISKTDDFPCRSDADIIRDLYNF